MSRAAFTDSGTFGFALMKSSSSFSKPVRFSFSTSATNSGLPTTGFKSDSRRALASGFEVMVLRSSNAVAARAVSASALRKSFIAAFPTSARCKDCKSCKARTTRKGSFAISWKRSSDESNNLARADGAFESRARRYSSPSAILFLVPAFDEPSSAALTSIRETQWLSHPIPHDSVIHRSQLGAFMVRRWIIKDASCE